MRVATLLTLCWLLLPATLVAQEKETIQLPGSFEGLPFSSAVRVGNTIYLSGQVGTMPNTRALAPGCVAAETKQALENIRQVLEYAGSALDRVVKCTVFLQNINHYDAMNEVYASYFQEEPPARSTVAGSGSALGAAVEIECIALVGQ